MNRRALLRRVGVVGLAVLPGPARGQAVPLPGRTTLFELDPAATPAGELPSNIKLLNGNLEVVQKDGAPMLKASSVSTFLITLPQALPPAFTVELELVPKACCNPYDLTIEGTPAINQGPGSAHVLWDSDGYVGVVGGARDNYEVPVPEELRASTPGVLTRVVLVVEGTTLRLYTNGRRLYTLTDRRFTRGRVLRVTLGGQDDGANAVHLAWLRLSEGTGSPGIIAAVAGLPTRGVPAADTTQQRGAQRSSDTTGATAGSVTHAPSILESRPPSATAGPTTGRDPDRARLLSAPAPRTIELGVLPASGVLAPWSVPAARSLGLPGITATGGEGSTTSPPARTIALGGVLATGPVPVIRSPIAARAGLPGTTVATVVPAPRIIALAGVVGSADGGMVAAPEPRSFSLAGILAVGAGGRTLQVPPKTINLPAVAATGPGYSP